MKPTGTLAPKTNSFSIYHIIYSITDASIKYDIVQKRKVNDVYDKFTESSAPSLFVSCDIRIAIMGLRTEV